MQVLELVTVQALTRPSLKTNHRTRRGARGNKGAGQHSRVGSVAAQQVFAAPCEMCMFACEGQRKLGKSCLCVAPLLQNRWSNYRVIC